MGIDSKVAQPTTAAMSRIMSATLRRQAATLELALLEGKDDSSIVSTVQSKLTVLAISLPLTVHAARTGYFSSSSIDR